MKATTDKRRQQVMQLMADGKARTRNQIADILNWRSGPVCARVNELIHRGLLKVTGNLFDPATEAYSQLLRADMRKARGYAK